MNDRESTGFQREVARNLTEHIGEAGFALAGSGAVREHGFINRPTEDIDLFTVMSQRPNFILAVNEAKQHLEHLGYDVEIDESRPPSDTYAKLKISRDGDETEVDMCMDWRAHDPVWLEGVGWVLDVEDAVANKITAVISRGEIRDYLDALSIRESKRFSDTELYRIAKEHDETFSPELFAESLSMMTRLPDWRFDAYVTRKELKELREQAEAWMESIRKDGKESQSSKRTSGMQEDRQTSHRGDVFVNGYTKADGTQVAAHWRSRPDRSRI